MVNYTIGMVLLSYVRVFTDKGNIIFMESSILKMNGRKLNEIRMGYLGIRTLQ